MKNWLFSEGFLIGDDIFFFPDFGRYLGKYSIADNRMSFPWEVGNLIKLSGDFDRYVVVGNKVCSLAVNGENIIIINTETWNTQKIQITSNVNAWGNYAEAAAYEDKLFVFCRGMRKVIVYDVSSNAVCEEELPLIVDKGVTIEGTTWLLSGDHTSLIKFNLSCLESDIIHIPNRIDSVSYITAKGNDLYMLSSNGDIWYFDMQNSKEECIFKVSEDRSVGRLVVTDNSFIELPSLGSEIYIIDKNSNNCKAYKSYPADFQYIGDKGWSKYKGIIRYRNSYIIAPRSSNYLLFIDEKSGNISWKKAVLPEPVDIMTHYLNYDGFVSEDMVGVNDFIKFVC